MNDKLNLPPERDLRNADAMLDDILGDVVHVGPEPRTRARGTAWRIAVAAATVLAVGVLASQVRGRGPSPQVAQTPSQTVSVTPSPEVPVSVDPSLSPATPVTEGPDPETTGLRTELILGAPSSYQANGVTYLEFHVAAHTGNGEPLGHYEARLVTDRGDLEPTDLTGVPRPEATAMQPPALLPTPEEMASLDSIDGVVAFKLSAGTTPATFEFALPESPDAAAATFQLIEAEPDARPTGPVTATAEPPGTLGLRYFDVSVLDQRFNDLGTATGVKVRVCYAAPHPEANADGTTRVSPDPWRFGVYDGETQLPEDTQYPRPAELGEPTDEFGPLLEARQVALGECNEGWIAVEHGNPDLAWTAARYQPADFGDEITWDLTSDGEGGNS